MYLPSSFEMAAPNFICPICVCVANALLVTSTSQFFLFKKHRHKITILSQKVLLSSKWHQKACYKKKKKTCRRSNCAYNLDQNDIFSQTRDVKRLLKDQASASGDLNCVRILTPFDTFYIKDQSNNLKGILMFEMAIEDPAVAN